MSILFGHPTGNPNAHQAALAHFEAGRLEAFCVAWMPSALTTQLLQAVPGMNALGRRFGRRRCAALAGAPKVQARLREFLRLARRLSGADEARLAQDRNDWLMQTMRRLSRRPAVTAVHAYEDCSLLSFEEAKRLGKACIYDMPIGYFPVWERTQTELNRRYADWLPAAHRATQAQVRHEQKRREMELADIVLVPSRFVDETIRSYFPKKTVARAPYGVDLEFWRPGQEARRRGPLRFIFAGQISIRKGAPSLIDAWRKAGLRDAELELVGSWQLSDAARRALPAGVVHRRPCDPQALRERYRAADVLVFPSFFEGFGLVVVEAMASGLPVLASDATIAPEIVTPDCGRVTPVGDVDALVEGLRWFAGNRDDIAAMGAAARRQAQHFSWERYRGCVTQAVSPYL
jgi:starch synthase